MTGPDESHSARYEAVARNLEVLASPIRLVILGSLRKPTALGRIRVEAPPQDGDDGPPRLLSRQAVSWHLNQLMESGLVQRLPGDGRSPVYVINHQRLFALVDEMRDLTRLRPLSTHAAGASETMEEDATDPDAAPAGPRLVVVYGRDDGTAFPLADADAWVLGRDPECDVRLDYDAYASARHARITRDASGYRVEDLGSRNGTRVNGKLLAPDGARALRPGDLLTVGRSQLVYQEHAP